ncbi:hypothetical protein HYFRA_00012537 [Hymenoscyphus fraxineus]|uniref:Aminoglycoside phosphotransferase domain-containing protein n=1 Tax=Hymenoscyphus fraxineus TaxID=746836 RepID=A0A9N9PXC7_9HELO|nr:hypothetical protein HYFRA_00012537 [Hymenoscyphus fraxineus]
MSQQIQRDIETSNFVRQNISVPVPSVVEVFIDENPIARSSWVSMKENSGASLTTAWTAITPTARDKTEAELRNYLLEMHAIHPSQICIGSYSGGPAYDHRLDTRFSCGPFASGSNFSDYLITPMADRTKKKLVSYYRQQMADDHGIASTYSDLYGDHIFVKHATWRINGIVDWEMAGWWSEYWGYTKSKFKSRYQS